MHTKVDGERVNGVFGTVFTLAELNEAEAWFTAPVTLEERTRPWGRLHKPGSIDRVNGPGAEERPSRVSRFEARVLAAHWFGELRPILRAWFADGRTGTDAIRLEPYAWSRVDRLVADGLLPAAEVDEVAESVLGTFDPAGANAAAVAGGSGASGGGDTQAPTVPGRLAAARDSLARDRLDWLPHWHLAGLYVGTWGRGVEPFTFPTDRGTLAMLRDNQRRLSASRSRLY